MSYELPKLVDKDSIISILARECRTANDTWWKDPKTGELLKRNRGELLMLIVSELAEAMEGHRKNKMDDKLTHFKMFDVELIDALIRIFDLMGEEMMIRTVDYDTIFAEKMAFNSIRADHKPETRLRENGKKY